jgi:8-amino-7-oxononanoate synthase
MGPRTVFSGRECDYFGGTGYLGLQSHPEVLQTAADNVHRFGLYIATARSGFGAHSIYDALDQEAREYFHAEKVHYYPSGYLGNTILANSTTDRYDHIFVDSSAHFSIWDGVNSIHKPVTTFQHLRPESLEEQLRCELKPGERPLVMSDGIFPVSGEIAPLPDYLALVKPFDGIVYLDDAHSVVVLGKNGLGTPEHFGLQQDAHCRTSGTLSKALGGYGGIIWGEEEWVTMIESQAHIFSGASLPPLPITASATRALQIARAHPELRQHLKDNVLRARAGLRGLGWEVPDSSVPIICLPARDGIDLDVIREKLFEQSIAVPLIRGYSGTPAGGALRVAIFANHTTEQIDRLVAEMHKLV